MQNALYYWLLYISLKLNKNDDEYIYTLGLKELYISIKLNKNSKIDVSHLIDKKIFTFLLS